MLCLFNVHYGRWAWAAGEMPIALQAVIRENVDLVHNLLPVLSEHYLTSTLCVWVEFCCYASTGGLALLWLQVASIPAFLHLHPFFVHFPPLLFYLKAKHLRVRVWMFLVLLQLWQKGFFILVTCLPNWAWGSCKNTQSYCPLKMAFSHQKAKTETTPWFSF